MAMYAKLAASNNGRGNELHLPTNGARAEESTVPAAAKEPTAHNENVSDLKQGLAPRSRFESLAVGDLDERYVKRMNTELSKSHGLVKGTQGASGLLSFHSAIKTVEEGQVYGNPNKHPLKGMARGGKGVKDGARKGLKEVGVDGRGILGPHNNALIHCSESDDDGLWDGTYMEKMSDDVGSLERDMGSNQ
ncbi:hypothetical protein V6N12_069158 [Hibiscus sabdariffa]|uniref:Uncharacterized protein n=1 Tax=Hibiscus sabdariffa TaxID=183260 RepID=A0ABR2FDI0_9ROSI